MKAKWNCCAMNEAAGGAPRPDSFTAGGALTSLHAAPSYKPDSQPSSSRAAAIFIAEQPSHGRRQVELLVAACAVGVVFTFGAPVGGVLFAAEITSTGQYSLEHLPRAFFSVAFSLATCEILLRLATRKRATRN